MNPIDLYINAACRDMGHELFFPPSDGRSKRGKAVIAAAVAVCETCRVRAACADLAETTGARGGVFGGRFIPEKNYEGKAA